MLQKADEGHIVNTSSINGFWASIGPTVTHTAYAAAKFAVKGFSEALITDLRINAPISACPSSCRAILERPSAAIPFEFRLGTIRTC
jgi:NADP-dependent 3-hydroxy acid dehydrogenase YdfG